MYRTIMFACILALVLATGCSSSIKEIPAETPIGTDAADDTPNSADEQTNRTDAQTNAENGTDTMDAENGTDGTDNTDGTEGNDKTFTITDWESVEEAARGQTIVWAMWGGSEPINNFIDTFYGTALDKRYNITLKRMPLDDAATFVEQLLQDKEKGRDPGTIDLLWINGENFATLKDAEMLYSGWAQSIPNSAYVNWQNPALTFDFGEPIEQLESPWSSAQFQFFYDSERMSEEDLPHSFAELKTWACNNPGKFTYTPPGPSNFQATRLIKGILYEISGDPALWTTFDQATWNEWSPQLWDFLNEIEPCLWNKGQSYPENIQELHSLFNNGEIAFSFEQMIAGPGPLIVDGILPESSRGFVLDAYMIGDYNYVAIPANAPNKAAAMVLANLLLEPQFQAAQIIPENGFGLGYGIDPSLVPKSEQELLKEAEQRLDPYATPFEDLANSMAREADPAYQQLLEDGWREFVLEQ